MALSNKNQWELFGVDLRQLGGLFGRVWRDVFWLYNSPVRKRLDERVTVHRWPLSVADAQKASEDACQAILLPSSHVLTRRLILPRAALVNLPQVVSAEVAAASPFLPDDTAVGQRVDDSGGKTVVLSLVIVSRSGVMSLLHSLDPSLTTTHFEIWAECEGVNVVVDGFAEQQRNTRYVKRLTRASVYAVVALLAFVALMMLPWLYQGYRYNKIETVLQQSRLEAGKAIQLRNQLSENNTRINELQAEIDAAPSPLAPLVLLTKSLGDDSWLLEYQQAGHQVIIDGYSQDAAELIQQLTASEYFKGVKPLSAIRKVGRDGTERFRLELQPVTGQAGES
jgi:general secretion pathway protein L